MVTRARQMWTPIAITAGAMIAGALYTLAMGEDANWDWQNYHEYNVWAVITGRYDIDVIPAGFQTYFNPLVYFPVYWLRHLLPPPAGLAIMGAIHGLNLALVWWMTRVLLGNATTVAALAAAIVIAAFGPMTLSEVGTSFSDILTALPIVAGFTLILSRADTDRVRILLAGLLIGAAVGLKLTNVVFALGAVAAMLLTTRPLAGLFYLALSGIIGSVATHGVWSLMLWRDLGNPIFPLFNGVFTSPELLPTNILDLQFMPRSLLDALAYPFFWLLGDHRSSEYPFRDARFAIVMMLIPIAILTRIVRGVPIFTRRDAQMFALFGVSYAAWLGLFSIQRYAVALELLCGPVIVLLIWRMLGAASSANLAAPIVAVAIALWSQPGDWWRRPWSDPYRPVISEQLKQPAIYLMLDKPLAYVAALLPPQSRFYQLADIALPILSGGTFDHRIRAGLAAPPAGGIWEMHTKGKPIRPELLARFGFMVETSRTCVEIPGVVPTTEIEVCPLAALRE